jgi:hypothetical protein
MAEYIHPTVVTPPLPADAISLLEVLVLTQMYDWEHRGDRLYFFNKTGRPSAIELQVAEIARLIEAAPEDAGRLPDFLRTLLASLKPEDTVFEVDVTEGLDVRIFQDILRRCKDIDHIMVTSAWTCSRMKEDGFGGAVTVITAGQALTKTTTDLARCLFEQATHGDLAATPDAGEQRAPVDKSGQKPDKSCVSRADKLDRPRSLRCPGCGTSDVLCDASARWDNDERGWILVDVFEAAFCGGCEVDVGHEAIVLKPNGDQSGD